MESERHTLGQSDPGNVSAIEVLGIDHNKIGSTVIVVVYERHEPTVIFVGALGTSDEHWLTCCPAGAVIENSTLTSDEIMFYSRPCH